VTGARVRCQHTINYASCSFARKRRVRASLTAFICPDALAAMAMPQCRTASFYLPTGAVAASFTDLKPH
jgi:hypothetical protein